MFAMHGTMNVKSITAKQGKKNINTETSKENCTKQMQHSATIKHVENFTETNKLCKVAPCWLYLKILLLQVRVGWLISVKKLVAVMQIIH